MRHGVYLKEFLSVIDGDGERDAGGDLHGVDADGLAVEVDEGSAGVSEGDGRVRLEVLRDVAVPQPQLRPVTARRAHHARRDRVRQGQGAAAGKKSSHL